MGGNHNEDIIIYENRAWNYEEPPSPTKPVLIRTSKEQLKAIFQAGIDFANSDHDPREWNQVKDFEQVWEELERGEGKE